MSINKLALIRYKTIDDCLRNRRRKWTLDDLIEKVSDVLYEREGIANGVSKRTIQSDLQLMRSDKLGYNAPIIVTEKKYYSYEDPEFSITTTPINDADMEKMKEVLGVLKHLNGFSYFDEMSDMIARLENNLYKSTHSGSSYIQFENNKLLKGLDYINPLYQAILKKMPLLIDYKSFRSKDVQQNIYFPYLLKEYRNRWFLIAKNKKGKQLVTLALDRMISFEDYPKEKFIEYKGVDFEQYFGELLGVTRSEVDRPHKVVLKFTPDHAPYVKTKPLHPSQQIVKEEADGTIFRIDVILNFELEREILGFGECVKVLGPRLLANRINRRLMKASGQYEG